MDCVVKPAPAFPAHYSSTVTGEIKLSVQALKAFPQKEERRAQGPPLRVRV